MKLDIPSQSKALKTPRKDRLAGIKQYVCFHEGLEHPNRVLAAEIQTYSWHCYDCGLPRSLEVRVPQLRES